MFKRFTLDLEGYYRSSGYTLSSIVTTSTTLDSSTTLTYEDTRVKYVDVPVMVRWYTRGPYPGKMMFFFEAGGALREEISIKTNRQLTVDTNATTTSSAATTPANTRVTGVSAGMGMRAVDDFGLKLSPQVRYTRWMGKVFKNSPVDNRSDQLEISLSLTF